jgi:hypothetical protein
MKTSKKLDDNNGKMNGMKVKMEKRKVRMAVE